MAQPRLVIVGGGLSGARAAEAARERFEGEVVLVGSEPRRPCQRPPLSKELLRGEAVGDASLDVLPEEAWRGVTSRLGIPAVGVELEAGVLPAAGRLHCALGPSVVRVVQRVLGLVLAAMALQSMLEDLRAFLPA